MGMWDVFKREKKKSVNGYGVFTHVINVGKDIVDLLKGSKGGMLEEAMFNSSHIFSVLRIIIDKAKPCPWLLYEVTSEQKQAYYLNYRQKGEYLHKANEYRQKALKEVESSEILDLLNKPNNYQTRMQFLEDLFGFYNSLHECFIYADIPIRGRNAGKPIALYSLPPHLVDPIYSNDFRNPIKHYIFYFDGKAVEIEPHRICHIKKWNPLYNFAGGGLHAVAPIEVSRNIVNREKANQRAQTKAFINGGRAYLISAERPAEGEETMTQEDLDNLNDRIKDKIQGPENYMNIQATSASVKVHNIGDSLADMKLIEADKEDLRKICAIFNVDPLLLGIKDGAKYDSSEIAHKALVTQVVMPQHNDITEGLNHWLLPMYSKSTGKKYFLEADGEFYPELQPDAKLMREIYGQGHFTDNEFRSVIGWDKHPDPVADMMQHPTNIKVVSAEMIQQAQQNQQQRGQNQPNKLPPNEESKGIEKIKAEILKGCLMFYPDIDINDWVNGIRKLVPSHIVEEYEFDPHLTVLYGFDDSKIETDRLKSIVGSFVRDNPISIKAGAVGLFSNEMDIVKINVEDLNGNLTRLNSLVKSEFEYQNDYPGYKPHITIAYTKKGTGAYLEGATIDLNEYGLKDINSGVFKYSDSNKKKIII